MNKNIKQLLSGALGSISISYKIIRGIDYQTLSKYILKINQHKDIDGILREVSKCLKDILDYEVFGFALKNNGIIEIWVDPRMHGTQFSKFVVQDFGGQNIDCAMHFFEPGSHLDCHTSDAVDVAKLLTYNVIEGNNVAKLYVLPKRRMLHYHDSIIRTIVDSLSIAVDTHLSIQHLRNAAALDALTGCYNRRALDCFIENDFAYAKRTGTDISAIMIDLDNFKEINDAHGHAAGDAVLKNICALLTGMVRKSDYLARYGGEEFVIILPDTSLYSAVQLAHKIRKKIENHRVECESRTLSVTASFGVASIERKHDAGSLLREADERLYKAKSTGKNTVVPSLLPCFADKNFVANAHTVLRTAQIA